MVARVTLEIALRKEFDYAIPPELAGEVEVGTRVKVPFGPRQVNGCVTALIEQSTHTNLRPITKIIGTSSLVTVKVLKLARWIGEYYCCAPEIALKSVLPESVRKEDASWRERLFVRIMPRAGSDMPKLTARQQNIFNIIEEWRELPLRRLLDLSGATSETIRKLEDKGLITIAAQIDERDPYAREHILPTEPLIVNEQQARALERIKMALDQRAPGILPGPGLASGKSTSFVTNASTRQDAGGTLKSGTFLLHGVTGSGKTEIYLQAIAQTLEQGKGAIVLVPEISLTPQTVERFKARFSSGPLQTLVAVLHSHLSA
ncbi:MAG TPA: DEAD/DEAH box helicase, partial [Candidatus Acidoferrum sp.]|nr:DEAD/DEAH box helicase [Candidatus Acidoferrum sp.]